MMNRITACLILLLAFVFGVGAHAEEPTRIYAEATLPNLNKAMLRAGALDIGDRAVLQDYLLLNECDLYRNNSQDDFKLEKLTLAARQAIAQQRNGWPDAFTLEAPFRLDKYDFTSNVFMLTVPSRLQNVNSFVLVDGANQVCQQGVALQRMPSRISIRIEQPVTITGLPLPKEVAADLLERMLSQGNSARQVYARFRFVASFMHPLQYSTTVNNKHYADDEHYSFDGTLQSIDFYEDQALTKPIWTFSR